MSWTSPTLAELQSRPAREETRQEKKKRIINDDSLDDPAKIDALAEVSNWFSGDTTVIDAYMKGDITAEQAVETLAAPIDLQYSTANRGKALFEAERSARIQRPYHSPEKALEMWGAEEDIPEPAHTEESWGSAEGLLWKLWWGLLHVAKRIPWDDEAGQGRLLDLVTTFKARPDPPQPSKVTVALKRDWIWESGTLWSDLLMLGPSACETWNDGCGCGSGWTPIEQRAWMNINAFVARLTASGTFDLGNYFLYDIGDGLESNSIGHNLHEVVPMPERRSHYMRIIAVWVFVAGRHLYANRSMVDDGVNGEIIALEGRTDKRFPWRKSNLITTTRWTFWRRKLKHLSEQEIYERDARDMAAKAADMIYGIQATMSNRYLVDDDTDTES